MDLCWWVPVHSLYLCADSWHDNERNAATAPDLTVYYPKMLGSYYQPVQRRLVATQHAALPAFTLAMLGFALPLTAVTIVVSLLWNGRRQRRAALAESDLHP